MASTVTTVRTDIEGLIDDPRRLNRWYRPPEQIKQFHKSTAKVRFIVGSRGSSKTTTTAVEAIRHCLKTPGGKVVIFRKTQCSQEDTAVETFRRVYKQCGFEEQPDNTSLFKTWDNGMTARIPSMEAQRRYDEFIAGKPKKTAIQFWMRSVGETYCSFITFKGLNDEVAAANNLRSAECSFMALIEADQLTRADFDLCVPCLRHRDAFGNAPEYKIVVETNPPSTTHWIAMLEKEWVNGTQLSYHFWHIHIDENAHNLPPGFVDEVKNTFKDNPAMYARMVEGKYADAYDGKPVYYAFKPGIHARKEIPWTKGAYLVRSIDFGVYNACVWSAYFSKQFKIGNKEPETIEYWHTLYELCLMGSDTDRQAEEIVRVTEESFPFWNDRAICSGVMDFCDPSGNSTTAMGIVADKENHVKVLRTHGINPGWKHGLRLADSIALGNRLLSKTDPNGKPVFLIDSEYCPTLYDGLCGKYRYPNEGEPGYGKDNAQPLKGPIVDNIDHAQDSWRYGWANCINLGKTGAPSAIDKVGLLRRKKGGINPTFASMLRAKGGR